MSHPEIIAGEVYLVEVIQPCGCVLMNTPAEKGSGHPIILKTMPQALLAFDDVCSMLAEPERISRNEGLRVRLVKYVRCSEVLETKLTGQTRLSA